MNNSNRNIPRIITLESIFIKFCEENKEEIEKRKADYSKSPNKETGYILAEKQTKAARDVQQKIQDILHHTLKIADTINWESLKEHKSFDIPNPNEKLNEELQTLIRPFRQNEVPPPKKPELENYIPQFTLTDKIIQFSKNQKTKEANAKYESDMILWNQALRDNEEYNRTLLKEYLSKEKDFEIKKSEIIQKYTVLKNEWEKQKAEHYTRQQQINIEVERLKELYNKKDRDAIIQYCTLVLNNSVYVESFPRNFILEFNPTNKLLIVEYSLPAVEHIPTLMEVKYIAIRNEFKEIHLSEKQLLKMYDDTIYKITLRTIHELFEADQVNVIDFIIFNGWVESINKATGKKVNNCIVSIQIEKHEFMDIELAAIDPKACFKNFKGIGSSQLSGVVAIQPIAQVNKTDNRFIDSREISNQLDESTNLAAMDWGDFEHLIREVFEEEFSVNGGEVKVTQASRDGGVDAIAFDPDPIRGGKIVIQAKRYTNTVGVSAVRDLYGTVLNEGATKGILVTTTDYGPDAYGFAKNKPLTLLNGANLLYLLEKHGHKVKIDIAEARKFFGKE